MTTVNIISMLKGLREAGCNITPKCCKLQDDSFPLYCATEGGYGKPTAHAHVMMFDALPVGQTACRVKAGFIIISSPFRDNRIGDVRSCRNCSKAWPNVSK